MKREKSGRWVRMAAAVVVCLCIGRNAQAIPITVNDPIYVATIAQCVNNLTGRTYRDCTSNAFISTTSLTSDDATFKTEFQAWVDLAGSGGAGWTLVEGGALPGGTLVVDPFDAFAEFTVGGVEISIDWTYVPGAGQPPKSDYFWTQGLFDNYGLDGSIGQGTSEMDVKTPAECAAAPSVFCPPLYPFQYVDRHFYDRPAAPWPDSFFDAEAFLAKADYVNMQLTIYEGVSYGFQLSAIETPEPATMFLVLPGLGWGAYRRWTVRRRS